MMSAMRQATITAVNLRLTPDVHLHHLMDAKDGWFAIAIPHLGPGSVAKAPARFFAGSMAMLRI